MPRNNTTQLAAKIHSYMTFRAAREGVGHTLTVPFYAAALKKGCTGFFGVVVSKGDIAEDTQQPDLFDEWQNPKGHA